MALLEVHNISKRFGGLQAIKDVGFSVREGCIKAVIGPNGAGKTTLFNMVSGFLPPDAGTVTFAGHARDRAEAPSRSPASACRARSSISGSSRT